MNRFFRWFQPDKPEQPPQAHIVWGNIPPPPIVPPPQPAPYDILAEAEAVLAEAQRSWRMAPLAKTMPRNAAPAVDDTLLLQRARPITFEPLPLMSNPFGPDPAWRNRAITSLHDMSRWLDADQRITLELAARHPDWMHIDIQVHALDVPTWRWKNVAHQVRPILCDILLCTLNINVAECSISVKLVDDGREVMWSALLWVDDRLDDGLEEVA